MSQEDIMEEKKNSVEESGMSHWDEHQPNIDELCDVSQLEVINYKAGIMLILISFGLLIGLNILSFSSVSVDIYGNRTVKATSFGLIMLVLFSGLTSYYLGRTLKRPVIVIPVVIMITITAIIISIYSGPILIEGAHFSYKTKFTLLFLCSTIISIFLGYVGTSYLVFE